MKELNSGQLDHQVERLLLEESESLSTLALIHGGMLLALVAGMLFLNSCSYVAPPQESKQIVYQPNQKLPSDQKIEPEFEAIKTKILDKKCMSCHGSGDQADPDAQDVEIENLQFLLDPDRPFIIPGKPTESRFYKTFFPEAGKSFMPPKKSGIPPLTELELDAIYTWILNLESTKQNHGD